VHSVNYGPCANRLGAASVMYRLVQQKENCRFFENLFHPTIDKCYSMYSWTFSYWRYALALISFFVVAEMDRVRSHTAHGQAQLLAVGFTSIRAASCTRASDQENIRAEIAENTEAVDRTVMTLIHAGMSTPRLRAAYERGVDVRSAADVEYSLSVFSVLYNASASLYMIGHTSPPMVVLGTLNLALCTLWTIRCVTGSNDERTFTVCAKSKVLFFVTIPMNVVLSCVSQGIKKNLAAVEYVFASTLVICWLLTLLLSIMHIDVVATIPRYGPGLAQFITARTRQRFFSALRRLLYPPKSGGNDVEAQKA